MSFSDLPFASKVICSCATNSSENKSITPDAHLLNWEKWMKERKRTNKEIAKKLSCDPGQLLSNYSEDLRAINEEKTVLENTKIINPHDHWRGNPAFWRMPESLPKKPCRPDCFKVMTAEEKCEIPNMEYVNVPDIIREEKDALTTGYKNLKDQWNCSEYRKKRTKELSVEIKNVQPFKPDLGELFVKGVGLAKKENPIPTKESLSTNTLQTDLERQQTVQIHSELFLMANKSKLCSNTTEDVNVHLFFEYDINTRRSLTKTITIGNGTGYALRYYLTPRKKFFLFGEIGQKIEEQVFFYDKRERSMLPHEEFELPISFKTDFSSTYKLQLKLHTRPQFWDNHVVINLMATASYEDLGSKCENTKQRIESKAYNTVAKETIYDVLKNIPAVEDCVPTYYVYDKAAIFEAVNQNFTPITRRPKYIYNKEVVDELEEFYAMIRFPNSPPTWSFNIEELRRITKQRQQVKYQCNFYRDLMAIKRAEEEKTSKAEVKGLQNDSKYSIKANKTLSRVKSIKLPPEPNKYGENLTEILENILLKLQHSSIWINENEDLHESCYAVLCTAIDVILNKMNKVETDLDISKNDKYPDAYSYNPNTFEDRVEEIHESLSAQSPRILDQFLKDVLPAAECLKDIPANECETRYKTYYNIVDESVTKGKKKGKKGEKKSKSKKEEKKSKKEKKGKKENSKSKEKAESPEVPDINLCEVPNFDLTEEMRIDTIVSMKLTSSSEIDTSSELASDLLNKEYKRIMYDTFYNHLLEATLKLVDVIELHRTKKFRLENMKRILQETSSSSAPIQVKTIDLKLAIRLALDLPTAHHPKYDDVQVKSEEVEVRYGEPVQIKSEGSEWSILKPLKEPEVSQKPLSYPEVNVYLKMRLNRRMLKDVGTIMSNAGIHAGWQDFKNACSQPVNEEGQETRAEKEEFVNNIISEVVGYVYSEEAYADAEGEEMEETVSDQVFYDEDILEAPIRQNSIQMN